MLINEPVFRTAHARPNAAGPAPPNPPMRLSLLLLSLDQWLIGGLAGICSKPRNTSPRRALQIENQRHSPTQFAQIRFEFARPRHSRRLGLRWASHCETLYMASWTSIACLTGSTYFQAH